MIATLRRTLVLARLELAIRPWPLALGLGVGMLALAAPWVPGLARFGRVELWQASGALLLPLVAVLSALFLGIAAAIGDRVGESRFLLARPVRASELVVARLVTDVPLALTAGLLAALPVALAAGALSSLVPADMDSLGGWLVLLVLGVLGATRMLSEHLAAAALSRSWGLLLDGVAVGTVFILATLLWRGARFDPFGQGWAVAVAVTGAASFLAALVAAAFARVGQGRGEPWRGQLAAAGAMVAVLIPVTVAGAVWVGALERPADPASFDPVTVVRPVGFGELVVLAGDNPLRPPSSVLFDARTRRALPYDWAFADPSGTIAVALRWRPDEGTAVTVLRRAADGSVRELPSQVVLPGPPGYRWWQAMAPSSDGRLLAMLPQWNRLELWDLESGALLSSATLSSLGLREALFVERGAARLVESIAREDGGLDIQLCSLGRRGQLECRVTAALAGERVDWFRSISVFGDRLVVALRNEVALLSTDGSLVARVPLSPTNLPRVGRLADGSFVAVSGAAGSRMLDRFSADGEPLERVPLPPQTMPCGWADDATLLARAGTALFRVGIDGQIERLPASIGSWECAGFPAIPPVGQFPLWSADGRRRPALWPVGAEAPQLVSDLIRD